MSRVTSTSVQGTLHTSLHTSSLGFEVDDMERATGSTCLSGELERRTTITLQNLPGLAPADETVILLYGVPA